MGGNCSSGDRMRFNFEKLEALGLSKVNYLILLFYTILSILFTYPVAFSINKIAGHGDAFWFLWDFWSFKKAVLNLSNPYYTTDIFYPTGVSLAFSDVSPFNAIISIPLQHFFGLIATYNLIWILTFILSGFGTFLLAKYLTNNTKASFLSGLIFMFCPYHFAHALGHMNLTSIEWIPFYVLFLIKITRENKKTNALYAAFFLVLIAMTSNYYLIYMCSFTLLYLIYYGLVDKSLINKDFIKNFLIMTISFVVGFSPFLYIMSKEMLLSKSDYMYQGGFEIYSADLLAFFTPTIFHPIFKDLASPINSNFTGNIAEFTVFAGYTVLILSIIAILKIKTKEIKFWALSAITFFILCLGPILHVNGVTNFSLGGHFFNIPLPYQILMHIPVFSMARVPSRWDVLVMLSLAILAGHGLNLILGIIKSKSPCKSGKESVIFIIISCLVLFEFLAVPFQPFQMSSAEVPAIYRLLANETDDYAILEVPESAVAYYMYFQTIHGKKLVNGYVSRTPDYALKFMSIPLISSLLAPSDTPIMEDIIKQNQKGLLSLLRYYNIKYIIIHKRYLSDKEFSFASNLINETLGLEPVAYDSDGLWVYHIPTSQNSSPFLSLGSGFYGLENLSGTPSRGMQADATLLVNSYVNRTATLSLNAQSVFRNRTLEVYAGNKLLTKTTIPSDRVVEIEAPLYLVKDANVFRLHVSEGCERPSDTPELNSSDERCLSVAIQNITLGERKSFQLKYHKGFHDIENWSGTLPRWMQADATLLVNSSEGRIANLSLQVLSFYRNRTLEISTGNVPVAQVAVPTSLINVGVPIHLAKGVNIVRLHVPEGCERPSDIKELNNSDYRCLSVAVQNLSVM